MSLNIGLILQARIDSKRLPGKVMYPFQNSTILRECFDIMKTVQLTNKTIRTVVATSDREIDDVIANEANNYGIDIYRGSKDNVLQRFYVCALEYELDIIVRLTADNPFISPTVITEAINIQMGFHNIPTIVSTRNTNLAPGLDVECFNFEALKIAQENSDNPYDQEHVTTFMYSDPRIKSIKFETKHYSHLKTYKGLVFTIDFPRDYISVTNLT